MTITKSIAIEDLVQEISEAVSYLSKNGIRCIRCGEPIWGTLEEAAKEKGFSDDDIRRFVDDLNKLGKSEK
jgi:methionine synthase II (cobalamin-independent)